MGTIFVQSKRKIKWEANKTHDKWREFGMKPCASLQAYYLPTTMRKNNRGHGQVFFQELAPEKNYFPRNFDLNLIIN